MTFAVFLLAVLVKAGMKQVFGHFLTDAVRWSWPRKSNFKKKNIADLSGIFTLGHEWPPFSVPTRTLPSTHRMFYFSGKLKLKVCYCSSQLEILGLGGCQEKRLRNVYILCLTLILVCSGWLRVRWSARFRRCRHKGLAACCSLT